MDNFNKSTIPKSIKNFEIVDMSDGIVIQQGDMLHTLNSTAYEILELCDGKTTVQEITEKMRNQYPDDDIESMIIEFITQLHSSGLIDI